MNSVAALRASTGADGKKYEMLCLPVRYIFGWLFTINPANVKPEAQEAVRVYRRSCYDALYQHFFGTQKRQLEQNRLNQQQQQLKQTIADKRKKLEQLRNERLKNEPQLFD